MKLVIKIGADGTTIVDAVGFSGYLCEEATKPYEEQCGKEWFKQRKESYYDDSIDVTQTEEL